MQKENLIEYWRKKMTTDRRKQILKERQKRRLRNKCHIEILKDNKLVLETDDTIGAISYIRGWLFKTPFWEITQLTMNFYKRFIDNPQYKTRHIIDKLPTIAETIEKNLMFKDDVRKYKCLRCREESEVCGFCQKCYNSVYGLDNKEPTMVKMNDVVCNKKFMRVVENNPEYTNQIKESIISEGMKNPIILDDTNRILIGHHRFYIGKELGWDEIAVLYNPIKFGHGYFYEGKGYNLFVCRIDGNLEGSTTDAEQIITLIKDFNTREIGQTLTAEFFLNIGSDIRLRDVFIPERGHIVDKTWKDWWINKFGKDPR